MSYSYYLQAHINKDFQEIPTEKILQVFEKYITSKEENYINLQFDEENRCGVFIDTNEQTNTGITIDRPCGGDQLIKCLFQIMELGNFVYYEPDGYAIIINPETEKHLPEDMIEALGHPVIAGSWEAFREACTKSRP